MSIAVVQNTGKQRSAVDAGTFTFSFASTPAVGNAIVVAFAGYHASGYTVSSVSDNQSNGNYTSVITKRDTGNLCQECIFILPSATNSSGTFTITITNTQAAANRIVAAALEVSGLTASPTDQTGTAAGTTSPISLSGAGANAAANELVVAVGSYLSSNSNQGVSDSSGYTSMALEQDNTTYLASAIDYKIVSATETSTASIACTNSVIRTAGAIATFQGAAATTPLVGSASLTSNAPSLTQKFVIAATQGSVALSASSAVVTTVGKISPQSGSVSLTGNSPTFTGVPVSIQPSAGSVALSGIASPQTLGVPTALVGAAALQGYAPVLLNGVGLAIAAAGIVINGSAPQVVATGGAFPATGSGSFTENAPILNGTFVIKPGTAAPVIAGGFAASASVGATNPFAGTLSLTEQFPVLSQNLLRRPSAGSLAWIGNPPFGLSSLIAPGTATLSLDGSVPLRLEHKIHSGVLYKGVSGSGVSFDGLSG